MTNDNFEKWLEKTISECGPQGGVLNVLTEVIHTYRSLKAQAKPTAPSSLIAELREWCRNYEYASTNHCGEIDKILSRYTPVETPVGLVEDLKPTAPSSLVEEVKLIIEALKGAEDFTLNDGPFNNEEAKGHHDGCLECYREIGKELSELISRYTPVETPAGLVEELTQWANSIKIGPIPMGIDKTFNDGLTRFRDMLILKLMICAHHASEQGKEVVSVKDYTVSGTGYVAGVYFGVENRGKTGQLIFREKGGRE